MFYDRFIELCDTKGVKPTPLIVGMGLSSSNVSQWKKGSTPRPDVLRRIADYFGVSVEYLLTGEQKEPPQPEAGEADPVTQELYAIIDKLSGPKLALLLEKAQELERF